MRENDDDLDDQSEPTVIRLIPPDLAAAAQRSAEWAPYPADAPTDFDPAPDDKALRTSLLLTLASTVLPGSGLLGAKDRRLRLVGGATAAVSLCAVIALGVWAATDLSGLAQVAQRDTTLAMAPILLGTLAVVWVALIALTHLATRPSSLRGLRRTLSAVMVTIVAFAVAAPTAVAAQYARDAGALLDSILPQASEVTASSRESIAASGDPDPWANTARVNILLLGADGDASREERVKQFGVRTDTIMVASIDTVTGDATLIQIPRNTPRTPFPDGSVMDKEFPRGFRGEGDPADWYLNSIWEKTSEGGDYSSLFEGSTFPGAEALKEGVEGITGLTIDRFVMLNIDGLRDLIDAMGGVTVNVNRDLPIGGNKSRGIPPSGYIELGKDRHLGGYDAMWYARSRYDSSDYDRMARQSCLVNAIIRQANPETLVTSFEGIAAASAQILTTDITRDEFSAFIDLAFRVKDGGDVSRLVFVPGVNGYSPNNPDFDEMRKAVAEAIAPSAATPQPNSATGNPSSAASSATPSTAKSIPTATMDEKRLQDGSQNVSDACAWQG